MFLRLTFLLLVVAFSTSLAFSQNRYKIPSQNKHLNINLGGFKISKEGYSRDSTAFQLSAFNKKSGMTLSIFIERAGQDGGKTACRNFYWSKAEKSPLSKENIKKYETENLAVVEHDTKEYNGMRVDYHSVNAYLASGDYWVDVHVSNTGYSEKHKEAFDRLLKSIDIN
jgi:hypothetical protein